MLKLTDGMTEGDNTKNSPLLLGHTISLSATALAHAAAVGYAKKFCYQEDYLTKLRLTKYRKNQRNTEIWRLF